MPTATRSLSAAYVGVTGIVSEADLAAVRSVATAVAGALRPRRVMAGLLVSAKTMAGVTVANRRYPPIADVPALARAARAFAYTTIHYNSRDLAPLDEQLAAVIALAPATEGIQLNLAHPDPTALARFRRAHPQVELILQVNHTSVPDHAASSVDRYVREYTGIAAHALIDLSGGTGRPVDSEWASELLLEHGPGWITRGIVPGIAGGFGADSGPQIGALAATVRRALGDRVSFDAESRLRRPAGDAPAGPYQDDLDPETVRSYLEQVTRALAPDAPFFAGVRPLRAERPSADVLSSPRRPAG